MSYKDKKTERLIREEMERKKREIGNSPKIERVDDPRIGRVAYTSHLYGTVMDSNGKPIRVLDFKIPEDRKFYEEWDNADEMKRIGPDEELVRGYWARDDKRRKDEVYHIAYLRKKSEGEEERAEEERRKNSLKKEIVKPDYSSERVYKCSEGFHWVRKHMTKNGVVVEGYCARDPYRHTWKQTMDIYNSDKKRR